MTAASALALMVASAASAGAARAPSITLPSGGSVWLQESLTDDLPGVGRVARFRFVMPKLAEMVPDDGLPATEMPQEGLSEDEIAALNDGSLSGVASEPGTEAAPEIDIAPAPEGGAADDGMIPESAFDTPVPAQPEGTEAAADAAIEAPLGGSADPALPAAPDALMQDPIHADIVWLCETVALPQAVKETPRPRQIVISLASAESPFGTFDPQIVQLFEGFSLPADRDACVWEPW